MDRLVKLNNSVNELIMLDNSEQVLRNNYNSPDVVGVTSINSYRQHDKRLAGIRLHHNQGVG